MKSKGSRGRARRPDKRYNKEHFILCSKGRLKASEGSPKCAESKG